MHSRCHQHLHWRRLQRKPHLRRALHVCHLRDLNERLAGLGCDIDRYRRRGVNHHFPAQRDFAAGWGDQERWLLQRHGDCDFLGWLSLLLGSYSVNPDLSESGPLIGLR